LAPNQPARLSLAICVQDETVVTVEGCRQVAELEYATQVIGDIRTHEYLGGLAGGKLYDYTTVTREQYTRQGRIPDLIDSGKLFADLGLSLLNLETDRVMMCGNPHMLIDLKKLLITRGFSEGNSGTPGDFMIEKAFVER
jgi:ferredoxin/flavodoxin---NADP+ reductase